MKKQIIIIFIIPILFLVINLWNLPNYGVNWDEAQHFNRGQAYLHYFLTGKTNYLDLPKHKSLDEAVDFKDIRGKYMEIYNKAQRSYKSPDKNFRRSYYQSDIFNFEYFIKNDSGHPPLNGILAAFTNKIFYQQLGILGDLYSHHVFEVFAYFLIVAGVGIFVYSLFGTLPSIVASAFLALYPLFLGESHFNIKDPVLTSFFGLTIIFMYFGIVRGKKLLILISALFAGLSLGTKFNALFLPLIILPWLFLYWWRVKKFKIKKKMIFTLLICALLPAAIVYLSWPYLWFRGWDGIENIFSYYISEGIGVFDTQSNYLFLGFNFFPLIWIFYTTPIPVLILSGTGIFWLAKNLNKKKNHTYLLIFAWFFIPVLRVTIPNTAIYGGVRHIMEFIPALAIMAGVGAYGLLKIARNSYQSLAKMLIFSSIIFVFFEMVKIHPNENVYFNQIVGGLPGAKQRNIPYWGNSFGNVYKQGIDWLNENVEKGAKLGLPIGGTVNLPRETLRKDINLSNDNFSAFEKKGEYEMEMSHDLNPKKYFAYSYLEIFLDPVYEVKVQGVPILKIWKNDLNHTRKGFENERKYLVTGITRNGNNLIVEIEKEIFLTRIYMNYDKKNCSDSKNGFIAISKDGKNWEIEPEPISYPQISANQIHSENKDFFFLFAGKRAKLIKVNIEDKNPCILQNPSVEALGLEVSPN